MTSALDLDAFRDPKLARELIARIEHIVGDRHINLMEVCGTHTMSIGRYGFRSMLPATYSCSLARDARSA